MSIKFYTLDEQNDTKLEKNLTLGHFWKCVLEIRYNSGFGLKTVWKWIPDTFTFENILQTTLVASRWLRPLEYTFYIIHNFWKLIISEIVFTKVYFTKVFY